MIGGPKVKVGHMTANTPIWWIVCRPEVNTSYGQPVNKSSALAVLEMF